MQTITKNKTIKEVLPTLNTKENYYIFPTSWESKFIPKTEMFEYRIHYYWSESGKYYESKLSNSEYFDINSKSNRESFISLLGFHLFLKQTEYGTPNWVPPTVVHPNLYGFRIETSYEN